MHGDSVPPDHPDQIETGAVADVADDVTVVVDVACLAQAVLGTQLGDAPVPPHEPGSDAVRPVVPPHDLILVIDRGRVAGTGYSEVGEGAVPPDRSSILSVD